MLEVHVVLNLPIHLCKQLRKVFHHFEKDCNHQHTHRWFRNIVFDQGIHPHSIQSPLGLAIKTYQGRVLAFEQWFLNFLSKAKKKKNSFTQKIRN